MRSTKYAIEAQVRRLDAMLEMWPMSKSQRTEQREREIDEGIIESYTRMPEDPPDEWGDLNAQMDAIRRESMRELTAEERAAGFGPWES